MNSQNKPSKGSESTQTTDKVVFQAISMAFGTMTSRILGLVRDISFAALFPLMVTDAWNVAFRLPNMFRRLLGEGSLSVSFIPVFVEARVQDPTGLRARNLVNSFYILLLAILVTLTALGILFSADLVRMMVGTHFDVIPGKFELTVRMAQIMFGFIMLMSTYAYFMGILNALGSFALPAIAPTFFNIAMIIANFIPASWQSVHGDALAWGVIAGGCLQTGLLIPALKKKQYLPRLKWAGWSPDISKIFRNMIPGMMGMGLLQITTLINTYFAAQFGEGTHSYIYYADRLLELPLSLVSVSIGTALLPTLSKMWAEKNVTQMTATSNYYLRLNLFIAIPAAVGLYILALPIIEMLFLRGKFTVSDAQMTAAVLQIYAFTLIASSSVRVLAPAFYAVKNTWFPATVSAICLVVHLFLAPILMKRFGLDGLIMSTLTSATLNFIILLLFYPWMIGSFPLFSLLKGILAFTLPAAALAGVCLNYGSVFQFIFTRLSSESLARALSLFLIIVIGMIVYAGISWLLRLPELDRIRNRRRK